LFQPSVIATVSPDPLKQLEPSGYAALGIETWPAAHHLMKILEREPYKSSSTYLGPCVVGLMPTLVKLDEHYWLLCKASGNLGLTLCEQDAAQMLAAAGYKFDPGSIRFAHKMPQHWSPPDTMRSISIRDNGATFYGSITSEACALALPFAPAQSSPSPPRWAIWVAVHMKYLTSPETFVTV
jgi:hypothetical protein